METPNGNTSKFFVNLVSRVILNNKIVATFMKTFMDIFEKFNQKVDKVLNEDI